MSVQPQYYHGILRCGNRARYRELSGSHETLRPWSLIGQHQHDNNYFANGDCEMWQENGKWREDGKESPFDIMQMLGVEMTMNQFLNGLQ